MILTTLSLLGVIFFVIGISFVFRGYLAVPDGDTIIPRLDFEKLQKNQLQ